MWDGEPFPVTKVTSAEGGILELDLKDRSATGTRAFVTLRIGFAGDGTARMDFIRADGSSFGETGDERVSGPQAKQPLVL